MKTDRLDIGFIPLLDAAPLIVAVEMGFAEEEGLSLNLSPAPSWSALRDQLCFGHLAAAHMLSPAPVASAMGLGGFGAELHALSILSFNGNVIGVRKSLAQTMRDAGYAFDFSNAHMAGHALIAAKPEGLRIGVPFPFSMHAELIHYWLSALGIAPNDTVKVRTIPPSLMADAVRNDEVDAFCVGEPWGSRCVDAGVAELLLPGVAIWALAPEKVLAVRADWAKQEPDLAARLVRALWRAGRWLVQPSSRILISEILSRSSYLNLPTELLERGLSGRFQTNSQGKTNQVDGFAHFFTGAAGFPWRSQAAWIAQNLAHRVGADVARSIRQGMATYRTDIYRDALRDITDDLPLGSAKIEGAILEPTPVGSKSGRLILGKDSFFDGRVFEYA